MSSEAQHLKQQLKIEIYISFSQGLRNYTGLTPGFDQLVLVHAVYKYITWFES